MVQVVSDVGAGEPASAHPEAIDVSDAERAIADALQAGDRRQAIALCARNYGEVIGRVCMAMVGSQGEAEELAQETLLVAFTEFDNYRGDSSLRAWIFGIARKKCLKHLEQRRTRRAKLVLIQGGEPRDTSDELMQRRERAERAREALERIKPSEREALLMRYGGELSFKGVAQACGVEEAAARKRVSRALHSLREVLKKVEAW